MSESSRLEEFISLRGTIQSHGIARMVLLPIIFIGWAATAVATAATITVAISTLVPLLVLAAGFEAIFALHVRVERIGRYLEVVVQDAAAGHPPAGITGGADRRSEHGAFSYSERFPGGPDPLFSRLFVISVSVNFLPAALGGDVPEVVVLAVFHLLFINRIRVAGAAAARQRSQDPSGSAR